MTAKNEHISIEPLLNNRMVRSPSGTTTDRQVSLTDGVAIKITPTSGATMMLLFNPSTIQYQMGGSGVTTSTGFTLFQKSTFTILSPESDFEIYGIQNSGGDLNIDIVEFF